MPSNRTVILPGWPLLSQQGPSIFRERINEKKQLAKGKRISSHQCWMCHKRIEGPPYRENRQESLVYDPDVQFFCSVCGTENISIFVEMN
jgi:hypothetical protein